MGIALDVRENLQFYRIDTDMNGSSSNSSISPVPAISSSVADQIKNVDDSIRETVQNERDSGTSDDDDENDESSTSVARRSTAAAAATTKAKSTARGVSNKKPNAQTPKRAANKRNFTITSNNSMTDDLPDENENCRVSVTTIGWFSTFFCVS